jgi:hypothetical protein
MLASMLVTSGAALGANVSLQGFDSAVRLGSYAIIGTPIQTTDQFCIASQSGLYMIEIHGMNASGAGFRLSSGAASIAYEVEFAPNGQNFAGMTAGVAIAGTTSIKTCALGLNNAALRLTLGVQDFNLAPAGSYADTLTAIISDL